MKRKAKATAVALTVLCCLVLGVTLASAVAPSVSVENAANVRYTTADVKGIVRPEGLFTTWRFQYVTDAQFQENLGNGLPGFEGATTAHEEGTEAEETLERQLTGLTPDTTYHLRLQADNADGQDEEIAASTFTTEMVAAPEVTIDPVTEIGESSARFAGTVNPNAPEEAALLDGAAKEAYRTSWRFECTPGCDGGGGQLDADNSTLNAEVPVSHDSANLEPATSYTVRLIAENAGGPNTVLAEESFETDAIGPDIADSPVYELKPTSVTLAARVNPHNLALSDCHFVYGLGSASGATVPCESSPTANSLEVVTAKVSGLSSGSDYRFKLVAASAAGDNEGDEQAFRTAAVPPPAPTCPNAAIRAEQHARTPGNCRAFEMVSPPDKNGGDVVGEAPAFVAAVDGNGIAYMARGSFGDTTGAGVVGQTTYVAKRGADGWSSTGVIPTPRFDAVSGLGPPNVAYNFSDDLRRSVVIGLDLPAVSGEVPDTFNLYSQDTLTRELRLVSTPPPVPYQYFTFLVDFRLPSISTSHDSRHIAFKAVSPLVQGAPADVPSVYEWDDGVLRLASILPNGTPAPDGASLPHGNYRESVSPDGSRVLFVSPPSNEFVFPPTSEGQLYMRVDHASTAWVSEPETSGPEPTPENVVLQQMTGDSRHVIFTTTSRLLDDDTNDGPDLYLYTDGPDPAHESNLTLVTETGNVPGYLGVLPSTNVVGSSDDGSRIYFQENGHLHLWDKGEARKIVSEPGSGSEAHYQYAATTPTGGVARVTPDGRFLAFVSLVGATPRDMYLYDAENDALNCASCLADGTEGSAKVIPDISKPALRGELPSARASFLANDGSVFFSTAASLTAGDTNGVSDAYEFDPTTGAVSLLSLGDSPLPAAFADASASGDDVFIVTRERLVGTDTDTLIDLYDARIGGGFAEPPPQPAPCQGEACQGTLATPPARRGVSSADRGSGNVMERRCTKKQRRARGRHKQRCRKAKHRKRNRQHRAAGTTRRAAK